MEENRDPFPLHRDGGKGCRPLREGGAFYQRYHSPRNEQFPEPPRIGQVRPYHPPTEITFDDKAVETADIPARNYLGEEGLTEEINGSVHKIT